ncbi:hypothetical protein PR002_g27797 [Phytophthora rubi]|uniref:Secreted protein n=1 Tax=Phytophthora rubi TaxID=129364 RepID=A0A6A3HGH6_9STRA|nr:hypothetical protein PR002_g27797 [Phytophthora rubi]
MTATVYLCWPASLTAFAMFASEMDPLGSRPLKYVNESLPTTFSRPLRTETPCGNMALPECPCQISVQPPHW